MIIEVIAHTGSSKRALVKRDNIYHVYTTKKPVEGAANKDIIRILSDNFKVSKSSITLIKGEKSRKKVFDIKS